MTSKLAEEVLSGWIQNGETVRIDLAPNGDGLTFEHVAEVEAAA